MGRLSPRDALANHRAPPSRRGLIVLNIGGVAHNTPALQGMLSDEGDRAPCRPGRRDSLAANAIA
jgi:hypothetical protein